MRNEISASFKLPRSFKIVPRLEWATSSLGLSYIDFRNDISSEYSYETFLENTTIERSYYQDNNGAPGGLFIAAGMGYTPYSKAILLTENQDQSTQDAMKNDLKDFEMLIERLAEEGKELSSSYKFSSS